MANEPRTEEGTSQESGRGSDGSSYQCVVVKLGTNLLTAGTDRLDLETMSSLAGQIARLRREGLDLIVVSSGAIAAGRHKLGLDRERRDIPFRQVLAAVGQSHLMYAYEQLFSWHGITIAQALLTKHALSDRGGYLNARNTLMALMELGVIAIVNENDVVAIDEIKEAKFGDNDNLSAMVANLVDADLLVILTDIGGLYTADPKVDADARLITQVDKIDAGIEALAGGAGSGRGVGGMATKIEAAKLATASGVAVVIAHGREPDVLPRLVSGEAVGTLFPPTHSNVESRKRWMLSGLSTRGEIVVDAGAIVALRERGRSLLPAGVVAVQGDFQRGDTVNILGLGGERIACGIASYGAADMVRIKGLQSDQILDRLGYEYGAEAVHRNNLVLL